MSKVSPSKKTPSKSKSSSSGSGSGSGSAAMPVPLDLIVRPSVAGPSNSVKIYLNLDTIRGAGMVAGAFAELTSAGSNSITGIVTPAEVEPDCVELPDALRQAAGLCLGDKVSVTKAGRPGEASRLVVYTTNEKYGMPEIEKLLLENGLAQRGMVIDGIEIVAAIPAKNIDDLEALDLSRGVSQFTSPLLVTEATKLVRSERGLPPTVLGVGYGSIGGLAKELKVLRSKIELPLNHPELFDRFGVAPERGFLLYGPPGTGKTLILKAVANQTRAHIVRINGPGIFSKYQGETEETLRKLFAEAARFSPSIVFIDEVDALAPKRDSDDSGETESRVVATLLTLMDGMNPSGRIVVIAATNRPNNIDPALRRPGRFGQEMEIGIPDADGRREILGLKLEHMPSKLTANDIDEIAQKTHGYVGADIDAMCHDAVMRAIEAGLAVGADASEMFIERDHFDQAIMAIRPSAMREIFLETPKVHWSDIGGQKQIIQRLKETVEWPLTKSDAFERLGVSPPRGVLLYGPPGCSKTLLAKALATEAGLNFLSVKGPEIFNKYVGESERAIREIFRKARAAAPSIIFFDEIDALSAARGEGEAGGDRVLTSLLTEMDGIESLNGVVVLAATNRPDVIDPALMRPGRLDRLVYVCPPDTASRRQILLIQFSKMAINEDVDIDELAKTTEGCSGAEIVSVCQEAGLLAMNENEDAVSIDERHFKAALAGLRRNITSDMLEYFETFERTGALV